MTRTVGQVYDELLLTLAQGGDVAALERLAERWRPRHFAHARRLLSRDDAAADAVQDAWVGIVRGFAKVRDAARFPAWSYAIVTRRCRDIQRRAMRAPDQLGDDEPIDLNFAAPDDGLDLRRALAALAPPQRAAIALFYLEGMSVAEIAVALCAPQGTIKTRLLYARRALRRHLEGVVA